MNIKVNKINSELLKIMTAHEFRYGRQYEYVATEYELKANKKRFYADVIVCNEEEFLEFEIKTSKKDLFNESYDKSKKHKKYSSGIQDIDKREFIPNKFYFVITQEMYYDRDVINYINSLNIKYGIIYFNIYDDYGCIDIKKQAKSIHKNKPSKKLLNHITKRLSAENIGLRKKIYEITQ